ncbi:MAG TPA: hypothetical protein PLV13_00345 [Ilumatobacteraceae bacterium]|nr:hypothetical protein [Ilumatobacteraceae bacterium]
MNASDVDLRDLPLADLRGQRAALQHEDDAVSFVRRVAQARLDLVRAEQRRRTASGNNGDDISGELPAILGAHLTGGAPRPPRPADDFSDHPLARALDELCAEWGNADLGAMSDQELREFAEQLHDYEQQRSIERRDLFTRIDAFSAELVRRYRDGEADFAGLLADD